MTMTQTKRPLARPARSARASSTEDGQSLIEFALLLPVLLLIVTGIFAFGNTCENYVMLTSATSVGARQLAMLRGNTTDPCSSASTSLFASAPTLVKANITLKFTLNGVVYNGNTCSSSSTTTGAAGNLLAGKQASITATYPCNLKVYNANYGGANCTLTAQTMELVQ